MAEPNPIYPSPEPSVESGARVVVLDASVDLGITAGKRNFFDETLFRAGRSLWQLRNAAESALVNVRRLAIYVAEERPVHLVAGIAIAASVAGSGLRIWRTYHE
jgi:hypothetical protein